MTKNVIATAEKIMTVSVESITSTMKAIVMNTSAIAPAINN